MHQIDSVGRREDVRKTEVDDLGGVVTQRLAEQRRVRIVHDCRRRVHDDPYGWLLARIRATA